MSTQTFPLLVSTSLHLHRNQMESLSLFVARNRTGASQTLSRVFPWCRDTHFRTIHSDNIELRTSKFSSYQLPSAPMQHAESCQILQRPPLMPLGRMKMQFGTFWNSPRESSNTPLAPADSRRQEDTSAGSALLSYRENSLEYGLRVQSDPSKVWVITERTGAPLGSCTTLCGYSLDKIKHI
jgi:hypothetical protein